MDSPDNRRLIDLRKLKSTKGMETIMNGWKAAGISKVVADARNNIGRLAEAL